MEILKMNEQENSLGKENFDGRKRLAIDNIKFFLRQKNRKDIDVIDKEGYFKALHILLEHGGSPGEYDRSGKSNLEVEIGDYPVHLRKLFWWKGNKGDRHHYVYVGLSSKRGTEASFLLQIEKYSIIPLPTILTTRDHDNSRKIGQILDFLGAGLNEMSKTEIGQDKIRYNRASF